MEDSCLAEANEWEKHRTEKEQLYDLNVLEMKENIKALSDKLQESQEKEVSLRREMVDLELLIDREKNTIKVLQSEMSKKDGQMKFELEKFEQERQKWDEKLRLKNEELANARCNIDCVQAKCLELEKTLQSVESRLDQKTQGLSTAQNELREIEDRIMLRMDEEATLKGHLAESERERDELRLQRDELKTALQLAYKKTEDLTNIENALRKELRIVKSQLQDDEKKSEKLANDLKQLKKENKQLESSLAEKTAEITSSSFLIKQFEKAQQQAMKELDEEKQKVCVKV
ncbi:unnamed protein product [Gongylonema pulchrum]|uniref:Myosin_tail_1 domain-containing protein n=1 Tax=Gongylonema pulchrum TaxID=637853 RepID=A0A183DZN3_9BILA|nr:unnamed protein product [Gongylonema pulchrum]